MFVQKLKMGVSVLLKDLRVIPSARFGYLSASTTHPGNFFFNWSVVRSLINTSENFLRPRFNVTPPFEKFHAPRLAHLFLFFLASRSRVPRCFLIWIVSLWRYLFCLLLMQSQTAPILCLHLFLIIDSCPVRKLYLVWYLRCESMTDHTSPY